MMAASARSPRNVTALPSVESESSFTGAPAEIMRRLVSGALVLAGIAALLAVGQRYESGSWWSVDEGARRPLTRPLRLEVGSPASYAQLLLGLRVHHYRPQPKGQARFRDVFFDTPGWDLEERGYSYRFRMQLDGPGGSRYSVRIEQEPRFVPAGTTVLELAADLPDELGAAIEAGAWERALLEPGVAPAERLRSVLRDLELQPAELGARLVAELWRERLEISDKGRDWFQLDRESWSFRRFDQGADSPAFAFEDVVIDPQLGGQDPELFRRVQTMEEFVRGIPGLVPVERAPHERAIEAIARDTQILDPQPPR